MTLPSHLRSSCPGSQAAIGYCADPRCRDAVAFRAETKRWFITIGHAAFNSRANNGSGYRSEGAARAVVARKVGAAAPSTSTECAEGRWHSRCPRAEDRSVACRCWCHR